MIRTRSRLVSEQGFTLIELLVVILIIGILAAIALPAFLNQTTKGQDGTAKSHARNLVSQVEACNVDIQDYTQCIAPPGTSLPYGNATGQVTVEAANKDGYTVLATSKSQNLYSIGHDTAGGTSHSCLLVKSSGGCDAGTW